MPTTPAIGDPTARRVDEQFLALICNDQDLLAAEFDEIMTREWPSPPPNPPGLGATGRPPARRAAHGAAGRIRNPVSRPQRPGVGGSARQRSPPGRDNHQTHDKGR